MAVRSRGAVGVLCPPPPSTTFPPVQVAVSLKVVPAFGLLAVLAPAPSWTIEEPVDGPVGPLAPVEPLAPVAPLAPVTPLAPVAPLAPVTPLEPVTPFEPVGTFETAAHF